MVGCNWLLWKPFQRTQSSYSANIYWATWKEEEHSRERPVKGKRLNKLQRGETTTGLCKGYSGQWKSGGKGTSRSSFGCLGKDSRKIQNKWEPCSKWSVELNGTKVKNNHTKQPSKAKFLLRTSRLSRSWHRSSCLWHTANPGVFSPHSHLLNWVECYCLIWHMMPAVER